jgi:hypothetical protein
VATVALGLLWLPSAAMACSTAQATIDWLTWDDKTGAFEQRTIAYAPADPLTDGRSASLVVRYWGEPPAELGLAFHRGREFPPLRLMGGSCGWWRDPVGALRYGGPESLGHWGRTALFLMDKPLGQGLNDDEVAMLEAHFGPTVVVEARTSDIARGVAGVWLPKLGLTAILLAVVVLPFGYRRGRRLKAEDELEVGI